MAFNKYFIVIALFFAVYCAASEEKENISDPLVKRARSGDVSAQLELGKEYFRGQKRPLNRALALYYFKLAADAGSPEGMFNIGMCYEYGVEFEPDRLSAFHYYTKAGDFVPAMFKRAIFLETGIPAQKNARSYRRGVPADLQKSNILINELIKKEYPPALTHQAKKYLRNPASKDAEFKEAFRLLNIAVNKNDLTAFPLLAGCFEWGLGCEKNEEKAFSLINYAASAGDGSAMYQLGSYYEHGIGTAPDLQKAVNSYQKSAELGNPAAMVQLAKHYSSGFILKTDLAKAIELCQQAALQNERTAFTQLGIFARQGVGMAADSSRAFQLFLKAAGMGDPEGQYLLALAYKEGNGTPADLSGAHYWMKKSAASNYLPALEKLKEWNIKL